MFLSADTETPSRWRKIPAEEKQKRDVGSKADQTIDHGTTEADASAFVTSFPFFECRNVHVRFQWSLASQTHWTGEQNTSIETHTA